ncbi:P-loop containing nucleoside triphosphate hydrolase protein [Kalaharituber pfeilii]|nr:P-loop containing nucleoside triphosphate hydrolase protein [Kalaharituber pfeilii]
MHFLQCGKPHWRGDDFTPCIRRDLFEILLPLLAIGCSLLVLAFGGIRQFLSANEKANCYQRLPVTGSAIQAVPHSYDGDDTDDDDDEFAEHLSLRLTMSRTTDTETKIDKPSGEILLVMFEELAVLGLVGLHIAALLTGTYNEREHGKRAALAGLISWGYTLLLTTMRLIFPNSSQYPIPSLWGHTASLYMFNFLFLTVPFRTVLIHPLSNLGRNLVIAEFALTAFLCGIVVSCRRGNKTIVQEVPEGLEPSREPLASLFSLMTFSWLDHMVWKGCWKSLQLEDVWALREDDVAVAVLTVYRQTKKTASLTIVLLRHFQRDLLIQAAWAVLGAAFTFAPTVLLRVILEYVQDPGDTPKNVAWLFVILLLVTAFVTAIGNGQSLYIGRRISIRLRAVIIGEVYTKALRRKAAAGSDNVLGEKKKTKKKDGKDGKVGQEEADGGQANIGAIINLMAIDSFKVSEVCAYLHFLVASVPVQVAIAVTLLYQILGWSSIVGIGVMIMLLPINYWISSRFSKIQKEIMTTTDKRIHATNEVLQNIRIIKFFAWEERFAQIVSESRTAELKALRNRYVLWAIAATVWYASPIVITFFSFLVYTKVEGKDLNAPIAFTSLSLFNVLRVPLDQLADMITNVLQTKVSVDRVEEFLKEEETEKYHQLKPLPEDEHEDHPLIGFKDASFTWGTKAQFEDGSAFKLMDLNVEFLPGKLNIIAGPTGSGKTSMLMALLGEMTQLQGRVYLPGSHSRDDLYPDPDTGLTESVAYCAQQAWLVNDTIKANILFAGPYNEQRYREVLVACSLERDLEILDNGDETEVGEKGITLSGGQKQRISLARALYSNSAYILLDDCLSAVDSHTAKWIYEYCIMGPLMEHRTCILVTHNTALCVPRASYVVVMDNGQIATQGSPIEVIASGLLGDNELLKSAVSNPVSRLHSRMPSRVPSFTELSDAGSKPNVDATTANGAILKAKTKAGKKISDEAKTEGSVDWKVYRLYLESMGPWWFWILVTATFTIQQFGSMAGSIWIREWAKQYGDVKSHQHAYATDYSFSRNCLASGTCTMPIPIATTATVDILKGSGKEVDVMYYLGVYAAIGIAYMITSLLREGIVFAGSLRASRLIHMRLLDAVMRAKFTFFDSTPLGRIINRFSKVIDMEAVDQEVAPVALGMIHSFATVLGIVILITVITPGFILAGIVVSALYSLIGAVYLRSSRDLKRLESIQRSPLYQHFGETLAGVSTIRAYGDERRFVRENLQKIDAHNRPYFYLWACNRWLGFRVDLAGALVSFFAGIFVVISAGSIDAGLAGLSLTYAITFSDNVLWAVRLYAMNEQNMNSVERIKEYLDVEQEAPPFIPDKQPPSNWPQHGAVTFKNYTTRYRPDLDPVLRDVSFDIKPSEKVGIVGRTGAGKSSLALALFRSLEAETGSITIDGVNIAEIGLSDLREKITMVPQDPTLFTGTIRSNLDPFGIYTDIEIFHTLKRVQLISEIPDTSIPTTVDPASTSGNRNVFLDLTSAVAESGNNLSQGQKQLLCLARALLKAPKVILFDEATASIDYLTDSKIQATIRELESTTITIAHRLNTVIYYDKVLVLDQGRAQEFGHPHELLKNPTGLFRAMCEQSGEMEALELMAKEAWENKFGV